MIPNTIDINRPVLVNGHAVTICPDGTCNPPFTRKDGKDFEVRRDERVVDTYEKIYFCVDDSSGANYGWGDYDPIVITYADDLKIGDRVKYTNGVRNGWIGATGTITDFDNDDLVEVNWDKKSDGVNQGRRIPPSSLVALRIDTTKPLAVRNDAPVKFITETSEGHILVGGDPAHVSYQWAIYREDGSFVRSSDDSGSGTVLRNLEPETKVIPRTLSVNGKTVSLDITTVDGVVTNVEWNK